MVDVLQQIEANRRQAAIAASRNGAEPIDIDALIRELAP